MTPAELKFARAQLGLTQAGLARALKMAGANAAVTVGKWERGALDVPGYAIVILDLAINIPDVRQRLEIMHSF